jgi:outer membrane lipoprotein-sorting protein
MKGNLLWALAACGLILGCNQAQSPQDVQEAQNEAQNEMAEAQQDMADEQRDQTDMGDSATAAQDASRVAAENEYKIAVAQADCKERADSELERAKREAERRRDGSG